MKQIAIIGAGNVGSALARAWANAGHRVLIGTRDTTQPDLQSLSSQKGISLHTHQDAAAAAEAILFSIPAAVMPTLVPTLGNLSGKVLIDATNSIREKPHPYANGFEALKALAPQSLVVKCFNSTGFENMEHPISETKYGSIALDMFMAGSSLAAKQVAESLATDAGFEACYDFGGDDKVELLEHFAMAWINLAIMQKQGRSIGFKVLKRR
ncbi:MAG: NAD(P)-binding domain-containing protein [Chloroherpetonaceae bacterium]|nr:NAD(P)-binding domain-containing protein [Chloroherpetonaceae bacterium]